MYKLFIIIFFILGCSSNNINKELNFSVSYYAGVVEEGNTGILKLLYPIKNIEKNKMVTYVKAYYRQGDLYKVEKYKTNKQRAEEIFFINKNNRYYKLKRKYKNTFISCDLSYTGNKVIIKKIICSDGTTQIVKMSKLHLISDMKYNKTGTLIKKSIFINGDIETFEYKEGKMIKINDEIE